MKETKIKIESFKELMTGDLVWYVDPNTTLPHFYRFVSRNPAVEYDDNDDDLTYIFVEDNPNSLIEGQPKLFSKCDVEKYNWYLFDFKNSINDIIKERIKCCDEIKNKLTSLLY